MDLSDVSADLSKEELVRRLLEQVNSLKSEDIVKMMSAVQNTSTVESTTSVCEEKDEVETSASYDSNKDINKEPPLPNAKQESEKVTENPKDGKETNAFETNKTYKRRVGTTDSGRDYEFKMLTLLCIRCIIKKPETMWIVTNADNVGDFDDIIVYLKTKETSGITFMIQMKHKEAESEITQADFTHRGKPFNLIKHTQGFSKLKETLGNTTRSGDVIENLDPDKIVSVFFTNRIAANSGIPYFEECTNEDLTFLNTGVKNKRLYKFDFTASDALGLANLDYCRNIYFLSNQVKESDADVCIFEEMQNLIKDLGLSKVNARNIAKDFTEYVTKWAKCKLGNSQYLTKEQVLYKLTDLFLSKYAVKFRNEPCAFYDYPTKNIWNRIVDDRIITYVAFDRGAFTFLKEYVGSEVRKYIKLENKWDGNLSDKNKKSFFDKNSNLSVIGKHGTPTMLDVYKCLWLDRKLPLLLELNSKNDHQNVLNILEWSKLCLKIIIVNKVDLTLPAALDVKTNFVNLNDLNEENRRLILEQSVSLQGRTGHKLGELIKEPMYKFIKCKDIVQILSGNYNIGNVYSSTDKYFIDRSVYRILVKFEALLQINEEIFVIRNEAPEGVLTNKLESLNLNPNVSNIIVAQDISSKELKKLKSKHGTIHRLICYGEDCLEWIESLGRTKNIQEYLAPLNISHNVGFVDKIHNDVTNSTLNKTHVFSGSPGMGKSTLMDFISNEAPTNMWVLKITLNDHTEHYESALSNKGSDHIKYFNEQIINNGSCFNIPLAKAVFQKLLTENKILLLLDGFDEVTVSYKDEATKIMKTLHDGLNHMWISTRPHMNSHLEKEFDTIAITITPFTLQDQRNFFLKYFTEFIRNPTRYKALIDEFIENLLKAAENNLTDWDHKFMEIPLQCKLLADVFIDDLKTSVSERVINFNENFSLLQLYEEFMNKKRMILCNTYGKCAKEMHKFFVDDQKLLALKIIFTKSDLCELGIDLQLSDYYRNKKNCIEILQREGILVVHDRKQTFNAMFVHRTFAEFVAAQWLVENCNNTDGKIKNTIEILLNKRFNEHYDYIFLFRIFDSLFAKGFPLHCAIINKRIAEAKRRLVTHPDDQNKTDDCKRSILHLVALYGSNTLEAYWKPSYIDNRMVDVIETMSVTEMIGMFHQDHLGYNPLDYAVETWSLGIADKMCEKSNEITLSVDVNNCREFYTDRPTHNYEFASKRISKYITCFECLENVSNDAQVNTIIAKDWPVRDVIEENLSRFLEELNVVTTTDLIEKLGIKSSDRNYYYELSFAVAFGTVDNVKQLLADINQCRFGHTPLYCAVQKNRSEIVEILLSELAEVNATSVNGNTALHAACKAGYKVLTETLLKHGANINKRNKLGETPLFLASKENSYNIVKLLFQHGADVNMVNQEGYTCLHNAAQAGYEALVTELIEKGNNVNAKTEDGKTPLFLACQNKHTNIASLLLDNNAEVSDKTDWRGHSCLHSTIEAGDNNVALRLIQRGINIDQEDESKNTPLFVALASTNLTGAKILLDNNARVDTVNRNGDTCLHLAAVQGQDEVLLRLLEKGLDVNQQDNDGKTPLFLALEYRRIAVAKLLIKHHIVIDITDRASNSYLHAAVKGGQDDIVLHFIKKGLDVNKRNEKGETPLYLALKYELKNIARLLLDNNAEINNVHLDDSYLHQAANAGLDDVVIRLIEENHDVNKRNSHAETPLYLALKNKHVATVKILLESDAEVDDIDEQGNSYLHLAASIEDDAVTRWLILEGLDVNKQNKNGETPLQLAQNYKNVNIAKLLEEKGTKTNKAAFEHFCICTEIVAGKNDALFEYIQQGFDVNIKNEDNMTPLFTALECGNIAAAHLLLENNAEIDTVDAWGNSCLHAAVTSGDIDIIDKFIQRGLDIDKENENGTTPLFLAFEYENFTAVELLIKKNPQFDNVDCWGNSYLHAAAKSGEIDIMRLLIEKGLDINKRNEYDVTPFFCAIENGHVGAAEFLLDNNADVNSSIDRTWKNSCLHVAAVAGTIEIVRRLLNKGFDVNQKNNEGETALSLALEKGHVDVVRLLLENNVTIDGVDCRGNTCLHAAAKTGLNDIARQLVEKRLDVNKQNWLGETPLLLALKNNYMDIVETLIINGADLNLRTKDDSCHLHYAAWGGCLLKWIKLLLANDAHSKNKKRNISLKVVNNKNQTLLHFAVFKIFCKDADEVVGRILTVKFLVGEGIDVNKEDNERRTVLHYICDYPNWYENVLTDYFYKTVTSLILNTNIDVNVKDAKGKMGLDLAIKNKYGEIATLIRERVERETSE